MPREELQAKYRDLPGYQIRQILDGEIELDNFNAKHLGQNGSENAVLALTGSGASKWKSVEETLQWQTNSWKPLLVTTWRLYQWPIQGQGLP